MANVTIIKIKHAAKITFSWHAAYITTVNPGLLTATKYSDW